MSGGSLPPSLRDLVRAVRDPRDLESFTLAQWDLLLPLARRSDLIARLACVAEAAGVIDRLPEPVQRHLAGALLLYRRQQVNAAFEIEELAAVCSERGLRLTLLKGAAYFATNLGFAQGRAFGDIDILIDKRQLGELESLLMREGWINAIDDAYDQRYYREWMHELPPMIHIQRGTVLDVHHRILPETARARPDPQRMLAAALECASFPGVYVLAPHDMLLHSATHLFYEGELTHGFRDLFDIDAMLRTVGPEQSWRELLERAQALQLTRPLYFACHFTAELLDTPIPPFVSARLAQWHTDGSAAQLLMRAYRLALRPMHPALNEPLTGLARWLIYARAHWLRMPPMLLVRHLGRKAIRGWLGIQGRPVDRPAPKQH